MATLAALGFKMHTGWAVLIAVNETTSKFELLLRRRVELLPPGDSIPRFVYHHAAELSLTQAAKLIGQAESAACESARAAVGDALDHLRLLGVSVKAAGLASASKPVPTDLAAVLRSHPMIHTAEAALFRRAIASACEGRQLAVVSTREGEIWCATAGAWSLKEARLHKRVDDLRKSVGAPWGSDQKTATVHALLALASHR
jgi:hypothetical protein